MPRSQHARRCFTLRCHPVAVYYGSVGGVQAYFLGLGFQFPAQQNPADAFMDFISGSTMRPGQVRRADGWLGW
jgi:hypothetical protein